LRLLLAADVKLLLTLHSLSGVFEKFGPVEDVVTFPGRMYAFVNFKDAADAKAAEAVQVCARHCAADS